MRRIAPILCITLIYAACSRPSQKPRAADSTATVVDSSGIGKFVAEYEPADPDYQEFRSGLVAHRFLDTVASRLNDSLKIPRNITLRTAHCGEPNASYDPDDRRVTLCYELFRTLSERFAGEPGGEYLVSGTVVFALMHELGHALIHVLDLPTTGREEDAVDQLATVLLLQQGPSGDSLAFGAVAWFASDAHRSQLDALEFADDHGFDLQRVYNIVCWIHGRDPRAYPELVEDGWLPAVRRDRCPAEYRRLAESWRRLLAPYRRTSG